ncbi:MAG: SH3 domain-containing protein [Caulobacteraceae bacterium]
MLIPSGAVLIALVALLAWWAFSNDVFSPAVKAYATRDAQVFSAIDPAKSAMLGQVHRGDALSGHWLKGQDGKAQWLKIRWAGRGDGFVWSRDLSIRPRPDLTASDQSSQPAVNASLIYAEPAMSSPVVDNLAAGEAASTVGTTGDGWTELALASGGVGYVQAAAFQANAAGAPAPATSPMLAGVTHYQCAFAPPQSVNAPPGTQDLSFYFDEGRLCINHTFAYLRGGDGGLTRVMLNDRAKRVSLLQFASNRQAFTRTDYTLPADAYAKLSRTSAALKSVVCAPPGDADSQTIVRRTLTSATPDVAAQAGSASWNRRVWTCAAS